MSIAAAGAGASNAIKEILRRRFLEEQARIANAQREQQLALLGQQEARLVAGEAADETYRTGQVARQDRMETAAAARQAQEDELAATDRRQAGNERGVMQLMAGGLQQIDGATKPNRNQIMGMLTEIGKPPIKELLEDPEADRAKILTEYEEKKKLDRQYDRPVAGPQPDYEWVTRGGEAVQIRKGTAQQGDTPYRSTSDSAQDRQREARTSAAKQFLTRLNQLREKINIKVGPEAGLSGIVRQGAGAIGLDPDVAEYERIRAAGGRALAVAIMGAQNLSDQDANAWSNMLPGARVDKVTAKRLTDQVEQMLDGMTGTQILAPAAGVGEETGGRASGASPAPGTRGVINGVPAVWDGQGWVAE